MKNTDKEEPYRIVMHKFIGGDPERGYTYELTFNKSMVHTGKWKGIEDGLNAYDEKEKRHAWWASLKHVLGIK